MHPMKRLHEYALKINELAALNPALRPILGGYSGFLHDLGSLSSEIERLTMLAKYNEIRARLKNAPKVRRPKLKIKKRLIYLKK